MTVDFGLVPNMSIGSTVFYDANDDGVQAGVLEKGIAGVTLVLLAETTPGNFVPVDTTVSDANGDYLFDSLPQGNYKVQIPSAPSSSLNSSTGAGADDQTDEDDNGIQNTPGGIDRKCSNQPGPNCRTNR